MKRFSIVTLENAETNEISQGTIPRSSSVSTCAELLLTKYLNAPLGTSYHAPIQELRMTHRMLKRSRTVSHRHPKMHSQTSCGSHFQTAMTARNDLIFTFDPRLCEASTLPCGELILFHRNFVFTTTRSFHQRTISQTRLGREGQRGLAAFRRPRQ